MPCVLVNCSHLLAPSNGAIFCLSLSDQSYSYEDVCTCMCNTGYELIGSPQRVCQSYSSWSGDHQQSAPSWSVSHMVVVIHRT